MAHCDNCEGFVTDTYLRVFAPPGTATVRVCPNCEDIVHDQLQEANVVFVAAPTSAISRSTRTLVRELNVGVLGVGSDGAVESLEAPRIVRNQAMTETLAIRFQASAQ